MRHSFDFSKLVRGVNLLSYLTGIHEDNDGILEKLCRKHMREGEHK